MKKIVAIALLFTVACGSVSKMMPTPEALPAMQQKVPDLTLERAQQGFRLYKEKCSGCHQLYSASKYTSNQWNKALEEMFPKAKVTDRISQDLIRDYLHALSK